ALAGADLTLTAEVLAAALRHTGFDLVIAGDASTDGAGGAVPAMLAEHLDVPHLTALTTAEITAGAGSGPRAVAGGTAHVSAELPAVVSVTEAFPDARLPKLRGIMAAKKKPYRTLGLADLGVDPAGGDRARSVVVSVAERPARAADRVPWSGVSRTAALSALLVVTMPSSGCGCRFLPRRVGPLVGRSVRGVPGVPWRLRRGSAGRRPATRRGPR